MRRSPQALASLYWQFWYDLEDCEGAPIDRYSVKTSELFEGGDLGNADVDVGYGGLLERLARGLNIQTRHVVTDIQYSERTFDNKVNVSVRHMTAAYGNTLQKYEYRATGVVVTLPAA